MFGKNSGECGNVFTVRHPSPESESDYIAARSMSAITWRGVYMMVWDLHTPFSGVRSYVRGRYWRHQTISALVAKLPVAAAVSSSYIVREDL